MSKPTVYIDPAGFENLLAQLSGDHSSRRRFIGDFLSLWKCRLQRLTATLESRDGMASEITLLSIRTSCLMVGANAAAEAADRIREQLRSGPVSFDDPVVDDFLVIGALTCSELERYLEACPAG